MFIFESMNKILKDKSLFSERLKTLIRKDYKTAKEFSEAISMHQQIVSSMITGRTKPTYDFFYNFLKIHSIDDLNFLLFGENEAVFTNKKFYSEQDLVNLIDSRINAYINIFSVNQSGINEKK